MNDKEELKQIYDIFTDCWRLYKRLYPPGRPEDDTYWQGMMKELEVFWLITDALMMNDLEDIKRVHNLANYLMVKRIKDSAKVAEA